MSILVVGSIALDTIETPYGRASEILGGSGVFISCCARYFSRPVRLVGVVGGDFPPEHIEYLKKAGVDTEGLQVKKDEKTFRWGGKYDEHLSGRETLFTELNAFASFNPVIPDSYRRSEYVCLGNIDPSLQLNVLEQIDKPEMVIGDTMNFWISGKLDDLMRTLKKLDVFIINDSEAQMLAGTMNLIKAGRDILGMGPDAVIIKKGEHGALLMTKEMTFTAPAYPLESVFDPTGAGDAFAGGFIGWIAKTGNMSAENLKRGVIYGNVMASFSIGKFSIDAIRDLDKSEINKRVRVIHEITKFEPMI